MERGRDESEEGDERGGPVSDEALNWRRHEHGGGAGSGGPAEEEEEAEEHHYGSFREERNVWGSSDN